MNNKPRNPLNNKITRLVWAGLTFISLLSALTCADNSVNSNGSDEDYLFIEMFIWSYATELEGDCTFPDISEPATLYTFDPVNKSLKIQRGNPFPINDDLKLVMANKHVFAPLAGVFNTSIKITPVYYIPDQITKYIHISGIRSENMSVQLRVGFESNSHHTIQIPTTIHLSPDSAYEQVFKTIEGGVTEPSTGDSCILEYTDSLVITNYGLNQKSKINWEPLGGPG